MYKEDRTMTRFQVGQEYTRPGLYGPSWYVRVTERTETTVTFVEPGYEDEEKITYPVVTNTDGVEMCECWEYLGHTGYIRADIQY